MGLEGSFDAHTMGYFAYRKCRIDAPVSLADDHAFKSLQALPGALADPDLNNNGITRMKFRNILL